MISPWIFESHVFQFKRYSLFESHVFQYKRHQFMEFRRILMSGEFNDS